MELFLPGLLILVLAALFIFLIVPRTGPMILAVVSLVALIGAGLHHYNLFSSEYALSTWQYGLTAYAPWIVLGLALLFIIAAISFIFSSPEAKANVMERVSTPMQAIQTAVQESVATMPPASTATNPLTGALNRGLNVVLQPEAAPTNQYRNRAPNKSPNIPGAGFPASQF